MQFSVRGVMTFLDAVLQAGATLRSTAGVFEVFARHWDLSAETLESTFGKQKSVERRSWMRGLEKVNKR